MPAFFFNISGRPSMWFGPPAYILLMFTPGALVTFATPLKNVPFWARFFAGAMLSPLLLCIEFYAFRVAGVSFSSTAVILAFLNLPALYFMWKRRREVASPTKASCLLAAAAVVIPALCMLGNLMYPEVAMYSPHSWYHADVVYMLARGDLVLESPTLAGMRLSYPLWTPLVASAVQSFLLDLPPVCAYVWRDLLELIAIYAFAAGITSALGGGKLAQLTAGIWLLLGTNPIGYMLTKVAPAGAAHELWGDFRYTPWVSKFVLFNPMTLGLGLFMALLYFLIRSWPLTKSVLFVIALLLSAVGLLYPLLFPPACGLVAIRAATPMLRQTKREWPWREWILWAGVLLIAALMTYAEIKFVSSSRKSAEHTVLLSQPVSAARKTLEGLISTSLLLAGLVFTLRGRWKEKPAETALLVGGALFSYALYAIFFIPFYENEYKFIFSAAMCLAAFPAIAVEKIWHTWPRSYAVPLVAGLVLLVFGPYVQNTFAQWPAPWLTLPLHRFEKRPQLDPSRFHLTLIQPEDWGKLCAAVLIKTPPDSVLLMDNAAVYYPPFMARSLFVTARNRLYPGVNLFPDEIDGDLRGYGRATIQRRRAILADFYGGDAIRREHALTAICVLHRPLAVVTEPRHAALMAWLQGRKDAVCVFTDAGLSLWLLNGAAALGAGAPGQL